MARWARICQECWGVCNGGQYFPDEPRKGYDTGCDACGDEQALSVNVHPDIVAATRSAIRPTCTGIPLPNGYAAWPDPVGRARGDS